MSSNARTVVESRRALLEVTRYDIAGKRIENKTYPVINTTAGQETHKYDEQGQLVETITRDAQGAVLRRTVYTYEYDTFGNWTKMTASIAVSEYGGARLEPREVTYRSIAYYDGDKTGTPEATVDGNAASSAGGKTNAREAAQLSSSKDNRSVGVDASARVASDVKALGGDEPAAPAALAAVADDLPLKVGPINEMALRLPSPSYPVEGRRLPQAIKVTVETVIDETGRVLSARALDGPAKLRRAAEDAARAAVFNPFRVATKPVKVKGLLVYDFPFGR